MPNESVERHGGRAAAIAAVLLLGASAAMFLALSPAAAHACGAAPLDARLVWSRAEAVKFAVACNASGMEAYQQMAVLDLVYPLLLASSIILASWWLAHRYQVPPTLRWATTAAAIASGLGDYVENAADWVLIAQPSNWQDSVLLSIGPYATMLKFAGLVLALVLLAATAVIAARSRTASTTCGASDLGS